MDDEQVTPEDEEQFRLLELLREESVEAARKSLLGFTLHTFSDYQVNWHHKLVCETIDKFVAGEIRFLMVFEPPRVGKSELVSRRLPAYYHGLHPNNEIMAVSYSGGLASEMATDVQRIMDTEEYQWAFPDTKITAVDEKTGFARNSLGHDIIGKQGTYQAQGVGGSFNGKGANLIIIDDPIKNREEADSATYRDRLHKFYTSTLRSRLEGDKGQILLTVTRWHEDDLAGRLLAQAAADPNADQWHVLCLPAIKENNENPLDPREIGESIWPEKFSLKEYAAIKANSARDWNSLYQQRPSAQEGNIIKRQWWHYYTALPPKFDEIIQSWDFAVKDKEGSDYTVGQVWGRLGIDKYLLDQVRGRMNFPAACQAVVALSYKWPRAVRKYIEDKANGPAVIDTLQKRITGLIAVEPMGDKVARTNAVAPEIESGHVFLPDPSLAPWVGDFVNEWADFPNALHDDQVDAGTQAIKKMKSTGPAFAPRSGHGQV